MTDDEARSFGAALRALTGALRTSIECEKVYSVAFGERIPHWHLLVMAIPESLEASQRGANVLARRSDMTDLPAAESVADLAAVSFCAG